MQIKINQRPLVFFTLLFVFLNIILLLVKALFSIPTANFTILLAGNLILFLATILSFYIYRKALHHDKAHAFIRFIYGGMLLKMVICIAAALVYILSAGNGVSRLGLFGCFGLYIIYTFAEVKILMQLSKQPKDV